MGTERFSATAVLLTVGSLIVVSGLVAVLEGPIGVPNASSAYLLAVLVCAMAFGTGAGILASFGGFLLYDFFFVPPIHTFTVDDPGEWLNLVLLLVGGIVVGQLAATQRARAEAAVEREREAIAQFRVSRVLATRPATITVLPEIAEVLRAEVGFSRVWIGLIREAGPERVVADTGGASPIPPTASHAVLRRMPGDTPAQWVKVHQPGVRRAGESGLRAHRVVVEAAGRTIGSVWGLRARRPASPTEPRPACSPLPRTRSARPSSRIGSPTRPQTAEIARQSDALKSALLESVSHDLRTPLATIRAAAGTMLDRHARDLRRGPARERARPIDRGGRAPQSARDEPARPEPDRGRRAAGRPRARSSCRMRSSRSSPGWTAGSTGGRSRSTWPMPARRRSSTRSSSTRSSRTSSRTPSKYVPAGSPGPGVGHADDDVIRLTVEDSGPGVPPEALAAAVREVLPGPRRVDPVAARDRRRPRGRPRPDRGDGRRRRCASERAGRPGHRRRPARRTTTGRKLEQDGNGRVSERPSDGPMSCSSRTTRRPGRRSPGTFGSTAIRSSRPATRPRPCAAGTRAGPTSSCSTSVCRTATDWSSSAGSGARPRRRS